MKTGFILFYALLLQLALLDAPAAAAYQNCDGFSNTHAHFDVIAQTDTWSAVTNQSDSECIKKIYRSDFSLFGGTYSIPAQVRATGYSSRTKKIVRPLRYQLCVLRL